MNEVTKLYENAGIEPVLFYDCESYNQKVEKGYLFTPEKQLELIKWLAYKMHITIGKGLPWGQYDDDWWTVTSKKGYAGTNAYKLEEALAGLINSLWQDLTEEEKQQIKEILE